MKNKYHSKKMSRNTISPLFFSLSSVLVISTEKLHRTFKKKEKSLCRYEKNNYSVKLNCNAVNKRTVRTY